MPDKPEGTEDSQKPDEAEDTPDPLAAEKADLEAKQRDLDESLAAVTPYLDFIQSEQGKKAHEAFKSNKPLQPDQPAQPQGPAGPDPLQKYEEMLSQLGPEQAKLMRQAQEQLLPGMGQAMRQMIRQELGDIKAKVEAQGKEVGSLAHYQSLNEFYLKDVDLGAGIKSSQLRPYEHELLQKAKQFGPTVDWTTIGQSVVFPKIAAKGKASIEQHQANAANANVGGATQIARPAEMEWERCPKEVDSKTGKKKKRTLEQIFSFHGQRRGRDLDAIDRYLSGGR